MATWLSGISRQHRTVRKQSLVWCVIFAALFGVMLLAMAFLQFVRTGEMRRIGDGYHIRKSVLHATRGQFLDRNLTVLALDDQRLTVYVDPSIASESDPAFIAKYLAPVLQVPEAEILAACNKGQDFTWVKRDLSAAEVTALRDRPIAGVTVMPDGQRYRVGLDLSRLDRDAKVAEDLAEALRVTPAALTAEMGDWPGTPAAEDGTPAPPTGVRWLPFTVNDTGKVSVEGLRLAGVSTDGLGVNYSLGADPRRFSGKTPEFSAEKTAETLAPMLGQEKDKVADNLQSRLRFVPLKKGINTDMAAAVQRLLATMYVLHPGEILDTRGEKAETPTERLEAAVKRLDGLLNTKETLQADVVAPEEIRKRLLPGAAPGPLAVRMTEGRPWLKPARSLYAKAIPGVTYGLPGISVSQDRRRGYPYNAMAAATLGFVRYENDEMFGAFGLEVAEDATLRGTDGEEIKEIDARRETIPESERRVAPVQGRDVVLTLDYNIQLAAEAALAEAVATYKPAGATCVVLDPTTGEVLALATTPVWDANRPGETQHHLVNSAVSNFYEPGSTFKVVAVASALEEGVIRDGQAITTCTPAGIVIGRHRIGEAHNYHGSVDPGRLIEQSCNLAAAQLALRIGPEKFLGWCEKFGFGAQSGLGLKFESPGYLNRRNAPKRITLANMGFGQSIAVTPIQLAAAYAALANGGTYMQPHLVLGRQRADGTLDRVTPASHSVCSKATADKLMGYLERVVTQGTAKVAAIPGYRVAGKTGTAQRPGAHGFSDGGHIASFVGIAPADAPRVVCLVVVDRPQGAMYGGVVAGPVAQKVMTSALQCLNIPPTLQTPQATAGAARARN